MQPDVPSNGTSSRNRRLSPRRSAKQSVKTVCSKGAFGLGPNIALALLDISETGARLIIKEARKPLQELEVCFLPPGHTREFKMPSRVVWCVPTADGNFCIGVQFDKYLNYAALQEIVSFRIA